jgi:flagellar basal-body rod protein FlgF
MQLPPAEEDHLITQKGVSPMDTALLVALSHQSAMRRQLDVVANNVANMHTTAFKKESVMFQQHLVNLKGVEGPEGQGIAFVIDKGVKRDQAEGAHLHTGNPLDVAISGDAFFEVIGKDGNVKYTRNGHFRMDNEGFLILSSGERLLSVDGNEIQFTEEDVTITIQSDGRIVAESGDLGQLALSSFANADALKKAGNGLYTSTQQPTPLDPDATPPKVQQFMLESSNVNPIEEVTRMITILRSYQKVSKLMTKSDDMRKNAINTLGKIK